MPDSDRLIFKFFDGERERAVDPLAALRRLRATGCDINAQLTLLNDAPDESIREEAWLSLVNATREVFDLKPLRDDFTGGGGICRGLTEQETFDVFDRFGEFIDALKKNTNPKPTLPPSSEPPVCPGSVEPANTNDLSASG